LFFFLWVKVVIYKQSNIGPFHIINKNIYFWRLNFNKSNFMKKILLLFAMFSSVLFAGAQNIQLLYNTGENQNNLTSTVEMFRPDKLGNTFFFIDFSYGAGEVEGVSSAYWEIARAFTIAKSPVAFHAEYNGGLGQWK